MNLPAVVDARRFIRENRDWLWAGGILVLGIGIVVLRFVGQILKLGMFFNSDQIFLPALYKDIFLDGHSWANWHFPPAPSLFPEGLVYAVAATVLQGKIFPSVIAFAIAQLCGLTACVYALARPVFRERSRALAVTLLFFTFALGVSAFKRQYDEYDFILISSIHVGTAMMSFALFALSLRMLERKAGTRLEWVVLFALLTLTAASDMLVVPEAVAPLAVLVTFACWCAGCLRSFGLKFLSVLAGSVVTGATLGKLIVRHSDVQLGVGWSRAAALFSDRENFMPSLRSITDHEVWLIALCAAATAGLYALRRAGRWSGIDAARLDRLLALFVLSFVLTNIAMIFGGAFALRYLFLSFFFLLFFGSAFAVAAWDALRPYLPQRQRELPPLLLPTLVMCGMVALTARAMPRPHNWIGSYYPPQTACLDREIGNLVRSEGRPLHGVAGYWETKMNLTLSRADINSAYTLTPYDTTFRPDYFIASESWFRHKSYDFVVVVDGEVAHYYTDMPLFISMFGPPDQTIPCPGAKIHVYLKHPIRFPQFDAAGAGYTWPACHMLHPDGSATADCSIAGKHDGKVVPLTQGPFPYLPPGRYAASMVYSSPDAKETQLGAWSGFLAHGGGNFTEFSAPLTGTGGARQTLTRQFDVDPDVPNDYLGLDAVFNGAGDISIHSISLKRVE